jgi:hypothetical protein
MWPNATVDVPQMVPYLGLESITDGEPIHFWDQSPTEASCYPNSEIQSDSNPKRDVLIPSDTTGGEFLLFPNPADAALQISIGQSSDIEDVHFDIFDVTGKNVLSSRGTAQTAQGIYTVPVHELQNGWYTLRAYDNGELDIQRAFIIRR